MKQISFIRWGNLQPVKHKEANLKDDDKGFHTAPTVYGIYAFPQGFVEPFLLSGEFTNHWRVMLKDDNGNNIKYNDLWDEENDYKIKKEYANFLKKKKIKISQINSIWNEEEEIWYACYLKEPHKFNYNGDIWHHFIDEVDKKDIIKTSGSWVKTNMNVYIKALHKYTVKDRFERYMMMPKDKRHGNPHTMPLSGVKDGYEVFIEKIK